MPEEVPPSLRFQLFRASDAIARGLVTPRQLRGGRFRRIRRDVYADARLKVTHELTCRAVVMSCPVPATIAGPSAAYLLGVRHAVDPQADVHVIVSPEKRLSPRAGVIIHTTQLAPAERVLSPLPMTVAVRTARDVAAWLPLLVSVPMLDRMLALGLVDLTRLDKLAHDRFGDRGIKRARQAFALVDSAAQSLPESQLRVRLVLAGLPKPVGQLPVRTSRGIVLHPDLAWERYKVAVEYDGVWHADPDQLRRDRRRLNLLVNEGWLVLHVTGDRMRNDFASVLREIETALESRGWRRRG